MGDQRRGNFCAPHAVNIVGNNMRYSVFRNKTIGPGFLLFIDSPLNYSALHQSRKRAFSVVSHFKIGEIVR